MTILHEIETREDEGRQKVLLVDDRPENLVALRATLGPLSCELLEASSGEEALRHLLVHDVALLILDVQMPGLDGYATAHHIREREKTRSVPLIFISGIDRDLEHQVRGYASGAVDFIAKPFDPALLLGKVRTFLELDAIRRRHEERERELTAELVAIEQRLRSLEASSEALVRENATLRRFARGAGRELLEAAQLASDYLELLGAGLGRLDETPQRDAALALHGHASTAARRLVDEVARRGRMALRHEEVERGRVRLDESLERAKSALGPLADGVRLTSDPLPSVLGDPFLLETVLAELLGHAIRAAGRAPRVHIGASHRGADAVVTIYGDGIPFEDRSNQGEWPGLALCRAVLGRLGGELWEGEPSEAGADVSFRLPAAVAGGAPSPVTDRDARR